MNRREFIRTAIATSVLLAAGVTGMFEIAERETTNQPTGQRAIQLPPVSTETEQSSASEALSNSSAPYQSASETEVSSSVQSSPSAQVSTTSQETATPASASSTTSPSETVSQTSSTSSQSSASSTSTTTTTTSSTTSETTTSSSVSTQSSSSASGPAGYVLVAQLSALQGQTSAYFTHPTAGSCILVYYDDQWNAFSAICTHRVCTLDYENSELYCPCHGATFDASNGEVTKGPARVQLAQYGVIIQDGEVWVSDSPVN